MRLAAGAALLFLILLGARDLWNPNEPLYGRAVVEMAARGDWVVPTVNGEVFDEKPILYFWLALAASHLLGGVNELTLRIPSALAGLIGVGLVYLLVHPYAGRLRARLAASLFATIYTIFWSARAVQMDLLVAVCTLGAVLAVTRAVDHGAPARVGWSLAGLAAGLGFLAKGPVGLICPGLVVLSYLAATRRLDELKIRNLALGGLVCSAVALPWFLVLAARGEWSFLHEVLVRQNATRFVAPWDHAEPWWYFLKYFWIDMAPWSLLVPLALALPRRDHAERRLDSLAWVWIASIVLFFSLSASKRSPYILPIAPAVAALAAAPVERLVLGTLDLWRRRAVVFLLAAIGLTFVAGGVYLKLEVIGDHPDVGAAGPAVGMLLVGGGAAVLTCLVVRRRWPMAAPAALFAAIVSLYLVAAVWVLPATNAYKSARPFCQKLNAIVADDLPLRSYRFWKWRASYVYYADRPIERIVTSRELERYWGQDRQVYLLVERGMIEEVRSVVGEVEPVIADEIGSNAVYLFTNR